MINRVTLLPKCTILGVLALQLASCSGAPSVKDRPLSISLPTFDGRNNRASAEYHYSLGQTYSAEGLVDRAIEEYHQTLSYDPNSAWVHMRIAAEWIRKGDIVQATEFAKKSIRLDPQLADAHLMLAGIYSVGRQVDLAVHEYDQVLKIEPNHEEAFLYKSQVQFEQGKLQASLKTLQELLKKNTESHLGWFYFARASRALNRFKDAENGYQKALEIKPSFSRACLGLGFLYEEKGNSSKAKKAYVECFHSTQELAAAHRLATLFLKDEKYSEAEPYLESIVLADPEDLNAHVKLGLVQMELKKLERAAATFEKVLLSSSGSDRVLYYLGNVYTELGQSNRASEVFSKITPESKMFAEAQIHVAFNLKQSGDLPAAEKMIAEAISRAPSLVGLYLFRASLQEERKDLGSAIRSLELALKLFPKEERVQFYLGTLYDREGRVDDGIASMESVLKLNPNHEEALNYLGYTLVVKGVRLNEAEEYLKRALKLKPDNGYIVDSWGWYLFKTGRARDAVVNLERAAKLRPDEPVILEHLADVYVQVDQLQKATQLYAEAARLTQKSEDRQKIVAKIEAIKERRMLSSSQTLRTRLPAAQKKN